MKPMPKMGFKRTVIGYYYFDKLYSKFYLTTKRGLLEEPRLRGEGER
jgi:hypothetical protein